MVHDKDMAEIVRQRTTERKLDLANLNLDRFPTGIWALFGLNEKNVDKIKTWSKLF